MTPSNQTADQIVAEGLFRHQQGDAAGAETKYRQALAVDPHQPDALHLLGVLLFSDGALEQARAYIEEAIRIRSDNYIYFNNLSLVCQAQQDLVPALTAARRAVDLAPSDVGALTTLGVCQQKSGDLSAATDSYEAALRIDPSAAQTELNLATVYLETGDTRRAEKHFRHVLSHPSHQVDAAIGLAQALMRQGQADAAVDTLTPLLTELPDQAPLALTLSEALLRGDQPHRALEVASNALNRFPQDSALRNFRGHVLRDLECPQDALSEFETILANDPDHVDAHVNLGLTHLALGNYDRGWTHYHARTLQPEVQRRSPNVGVQPLGQESVSGRDLIVWTEQGLGDEILQASLIPDVAARTASLTVLCSDRLHTLFKQSFPDVYITDKTRPDFIVPEGARACPLLSTANELRPSRQSFPNHLGYLHADVPETEVLKVRYRGLCTPVTAAPIIIGLAWRSGNADYGPANTIPLSAWQPIFEAARQSHRGVLFVSLQYDADDEDVDELPEQLRPFFHIDPAVNHLGDLAPVAAQVAACDLVISTSTTTVQLAGALGRPTWHLPATGLARGWYWTFDEDETPWYPAMRQFQRRAKADTEDQVERVADALRLHLSTGNP